MSRPIKPFWAFLIDWAIVLLAGLIFWLGLKSCRKEERRESATDQHQPGQHQAGVHPLD